MLCLLAGPLEISLLMAWQKGQMNTLHARREAAHRITASLGEVHYNQNWGVFMPKLERPGNSWTAPLFYRRYLGDRPVSHILFLRARMTDDDIEAAGHFPEADIYTWPDDCPHQCSRCNP
jgi:hypothetical protein